MVDRFPKASPERHFDPLQFRGPKRSIADAKVHTQSVGRDRFFPELNFESQQVYLKPPQHPNSSAFTRTMSRCRSRIHISRVYIPSQHANDVSQYPHARPCGVSG